MPEIEYVWDELSDNVIEEYEDGVLAASYTHESGLYGNLLSQHRNGATSYYHYDGRGDTVALTDDAGDVTDTKEYDAWGNVIASTGSTVTPYQYRGQRGFQKTAFVGATHYSRSTYYSAVIGRRFGANPGRFIAATSQYSVAAGFGANMALSAETTQSPVDIKVTFSHESVGPKCGEFDYWVSINVTVTEKWFQDRLKDFGAVTSPELLIFQHFHQAHVNDGCESESCGDLKCVRGKLDQGDVGRIRELSGIRVIGMI